MVMFILERHTACLVYNLYICGCGKKNLHCVTDKLVTLWGGVIYTCHERLRYRRQVVVKKLQWVMNEWFQKFWWLWWIINWTLLLSVVDLMQATNETKNAKFWKRKSLWFINFESADYSMIMLFWITAFCNCLKHKWNYLAKMFSIADVDIKSIAIDMSTKSCSYALLGLHPRRLGFCQASACHFLFSCGSATASSSQQTDLSPRTPPSSSAPQTAS